METYDVIFMSSFATAIAKITQKASAPLTTAEAQKI